MTDLADDADVVARLGRELTADELAAAPGLITESSGLIAGYLRRDWLALAVVPEAVRVVCSRMVARALTGASNLPPGVESFGSAMSAMSHTVKLGSDVVIGSPWLSKSDRMALRPYAASRQVVNVPMYHVIE